jgi:magnesium chelatase family protein
MFHIISSAVSGIDAVPVTVETDVSFGLGSFTIVGLPDASVKEARDRIRAALKNTGFTFPRGRVTVNLAPADLKKQGPVFDLPIAISLLAAKAEIPIDATFNSIILGELALDGTVRPVRGVLSAALMARRIGKKFIFVPEENVQEAAILKDLSVFGVSSLRTMVDHVLKRKIIRKTIRKKETRKKTATLSTCFSFIKGQELAKRGLEIAGAGGHNVLLSGPPGTGKTLLAKSLPLIMPELSEQEAIEVTSIASVTGKSKISNGLIRTRPFRSPHHSSSAVALVGGGTWPTPGEVSLAHRGVLFLDELPEFSRSVLEHLRQPLEDGSVTISRASNSATFPARFLLVGAMNPCPCGYLSDPKRNCTCTNSQIRRYQKKISGPMMDRFDLLIEVPNLSSGELFETLKTETSEAVRVRIEKAHDKQKKRFKKSSCCFNNEIPVCEMEKWCSLKEEASILLRTAVETQGLSPRSCTRAKKVARTIADLAGSDQIEMEHIAEALQFKKTEDELS